MKQVTIFIYQQGPTESRLNRTLVDTFLVDIESDKKLTASRASQIINRYFPRFAIINKVLVIKTEEGWEASRTIEPSEKCSFHYKWEHIVVRFDE